MSWIGLRFLTWLLWEETIETWFWLKLFCVLSKLLVEFKFSADFSVFCLELITFVSSSKIMFWIVFLDFSFLILSITECFISKFSLTLWVSFLFDSLISWDLAEFTADWVVFALTLLELECSGLVNLLSSVFLVVSVLVLFGLVLLSSKSKVSAVDFLFFF